MADETIVIEVQDKVATSISAKIKGIATDARDAHSSLDILQKQLNSLGVNNVKGLSGALASLNKLNAAQAALQKSQNSAAVSANNAAISAQKLQAAQTQAATAAARLAVAQANLAAANSNASQAALALAAAQQKQQAQVQATALAHANAATATAKLAAANGKNSAATAQAGISQKQYNAAMRGVPAQITDIIVSLQGGQKPLTVLLQQGGQLKDMFGGIVPAAKALSAGLLAMINPFTVAAAAIGLFLLAVGKVESSMREVNSIVAQFAATGRSSVDGTFIVELRKELALLPGVSKAAATAIISEFAKVRGVGGPILTQASKTVADLATALGIEAPEAAKKLASALDDPLKGAIALDKELGFLTIANFKTIKSLSDTGKTAQAQKLLVDLLSKSISGLAEDSMTPMQKATNELGNAWNRFTGELTNSGPIKNAIDGITGLINGLTSLINLLNNLSNMGPPSWITDLKNNPATSWLWTMGNQGNKATGGASGSWDAPKGPQYQQTTGFKTDAAGITNKKSPDKSAENRAAALDKITKQLDNQRLRQELLSKAYEKQEMFDRINESLIGRKIKLNDTERESIEEKIAAIVDNSDVTSEMNRIYDEAKSAQAQWNATITASDKLLYAGTITQEEYNNAKAKGEEIISNFRDPMRQFNRGMSEQLQLSGMLSSQREIESQVMQLQYDLIGKRAPLDDEELKRLREKLTLIQQTTAVQQAYQQIYDTTAGAVKNVGIQTQALNKAFTDGLLSSDAYQQRLVKLGVEASNLKMSMGNGDFADVMIGSLGKVVQAYEGVLPGLTSSFGDFFTSLEDGFANSIGRAVVYSDSLGDALKSVAQEAVSSLIGALIKLGIQYVVNAALGNSLAVASTAANVALAGATAAAWAPAAALASLASFGANAAPAAAGIATTVGLAQALAAIPGFSEGGYTGDLPTNAIAGAVHGKEFVFDAAATNRIGVSNLEAMRSGASAVNTNTQTSQSSSVSGGVNVVVENHGTPQTYTQMPSMTEGEVRLIAKDVVANDTPNIVAGQLGNQNSQSSKALKANFNVTPNRRG